MSNKLRLISLVLFFSMATVCFSQITDGCDLPVDPNIGKLHLTEDGSVLYNSPSIIGGWQFNVDGVTTVDASGGETGAAGLFMNTAGNLILSFSTSGGTISASCGTLVNLTYSGTATGLSGIVVSSADANSVNFQYYDILPGCMDDGGCTFETCGYISPYITEAACNYDATANYDDGNQCQYRVHDDPATVDVDEGQNCAGDLKITSLNSIPDQFEISQNFPNPFNPSTTISFNVSKMDEISLVIYDLSGKEVITLASGLFSPGSYVVTWDAVNNIGEAISSGMYVYRYKTSEDVITKKMLYLK